MFRRTISAAILASAVFANAAKGNDAIDTTTGYNETTEYQSAENSEQANDQEQFHSKIMARIEEYIGQMNPEEGKKDDVVKKELLEKLIKEQRMPAMTPQTESEIEKLKQAEQLELKDRISLTENQKLAVTIKSGLQRQVELTDLTLANDNGKIMLRHETTNNTTRVKVEQGILITTGVDATAGLEISSNAGPTISTSIGKKGISINGGYSPKDESRKIGISISRGSAYVSTSRTSYPSGARNDVIYAYIPLSEGHGNITAEGYKLTGSYPSESAKVQLEHRILFKNRQIARFVAAYEHAAQGEQQNQGGSLALKRSIATRKLGSLTVKAGGGKDPWTEKKYGFAGIEYSLSFQPK